MKRTMLAGGIAALAWVLAAPAAGAEIFSDPFNRANNNTVGLGWIEGGASTDDVAIFNNGLRLRDDRSGNPDASAEQLGIDTRGYGNLSLAFSWAVNHNDSDAADFLFVDWRVSGTTSWTNLAAFNLGGAAVSFSNETRALALTDSLLDLRFWTDVGGGSGSNSNEGALIDYVTLTGDLQVPEPASLALLGLGLLGLGAACRRPTAV